MSANLRMEVKRNTSDNLVTEMEEISQSQVIVEDDETHQLPSGELEGLSENLGKKRRKKSTIKPNMTTAGGRTRVHSDQVNPTKSELQKFKQASALVLQENPKIRIVQNKQELDELTKGEPCSLLDEILIARLTETSELFTTPFVFPASKSFGAYIGPIDIGQLNELERVKYRMPVGEIGSPTSPRFAQTSRIRLELHELNELRKNLYFLLAAADELKNGDGLEETFSTSEEISTSVKRSAGGGIVFEISRLIRSLSGELKINDFESVSMSAEELRNLLTVYLDPVLNSAPAKLKSRCLFSRQDTPVQTSVAVPAAMRPLCLWLYPQVSSELLKSKLSADREFVEHEIRYKIRTLNVEILKGLVGHGSVFYDSSSRRALINKDGYCYLLAYLASSQGLRSITTWFFDHLEDLEKTVRGTLNI